VLVGHVDTHRMPICFSSRRWLAIYRRFVPLVFLLFATQVLLYVLGAVFQWRWLWPASVPGAVAGVLLLAHQIHAESTPFSHGANDNATGAGLVLALAERLKTEPLQYTRVWLACTGCEEVRHYGMADFWRRHASEMVQPAAIIFEMLGCAGPAWVRREGIVVPFLADPGLVSLAEEVSAANPQWGAHGVNITGGNTEMADALLLGVPAITLIGIGEAGDPVYWHQKEDRLDILDAEAMERNYRFAWSLIQAVDQELG
jgi:hypothetical protein